MTLTANFQSLLRRAIFLLLVLLPLFSFSTARAAAHDYYVSPSGSDQGDGSAAHPWQTIAKAASRARAGEVIHVLPGTYQSATSILTTANGKSDKRVRYVSDEKWGAKIISMAGMPSAAWENTGSYVDIVGFDITGDGNEGILNRASHVRIIGNHVHNLPATFCKLRSPTGAGINSGANYSTEDNDVIGNVVHDIGYPKACNVGQGIYHANRGGHISNNISFHNSAYGICLWHAATANVVTNNLLFENGLGGIWLGAEGMKGEINENSVVANNIIYKNGDWSIREAGNVGRNRYENNLFYGNGHDDKPLLILNRDVATIHADPKFVHFLPDGSGDYHLAPDSPALGNASRGEIPPEDFYGATRNHSDLGPFARPAAAAGTPSVANR
jgi:parallel beta-helix repeat protein